MKKLFLWLALLGGFIFSSKAQCVIDSSIQTPGFHPDTGSYITPACAGSQYNGVIQIYAPQQVTISLGTFAVNYVQLDTIPDLPQGLQYSTNPTSGRMNGGERGCISIFGFVNLPVGEYSFTIRYTANFMAFGNPTSLPFTAPYKLRVDTGSAVFTTITETACEEPGYNFNGTWLTQSGAYNDTLPAVTGCDSIITLNLSITPFNTDVVLAGDSLVAPAGYDHYQWYDCSTGQPIGSETNNVFYPLGAGGYQVLLENGSCSTTTPCYTYTGLRSNKGESPYRIWPQPVKESFAIQGPANDALTVKVYNSTGKLVMQQTVAANSAVNAAMLPSGMYVVQISSKGLSGQQVLLKQ